MDLAGVGQGLNDAAGGDFALTAAARHAFEFLFESVELRDLFAYIAQMPVGNVVDSSATGLPIIGETQQFFHVVERKTEIPAPPNEAQALHLCLRINPVSTRAARRLRQNTNLFVIPDGLNFAARFCSECSYRQ